MCAVQDNMCNPQISIDRYPRHLPVLRDSFLFVLHYRDRGDDSILAPRLDAERGEIYELELMEVEIAVQISVMYIVVTVEVSFRTPKAERGGSRGVSPWLLPAKYKSLFWSRMLHASLA